MRSGSAQRTGISLPWTGEGRGGVEAEHATGAEKTSPPSQPPPNGGRSTDGNRRLGPHDPETV